MLVVSLAGCSGEGEGRKPTHRVIGTVEMAGGPVAGATVMFAPTNGQPVASGLTDGAGKYELTTYEYGDGAVVGEYNVLVIRSSKKKDGPTELSHDAFEKGEDPTTSGHAGEEDVDDDNSLPKKYSDSETTDLVATVEEKSENVIDLTLEP